MIRSMVFAPTNVLLYMSIQIHNPFSSAWLSPRKRVIGLQLKSYLYKMSYYFGFYVTEDGLGS